METVEDKRLVRVLIADENKNFGGAERHVISLCQALHSRHLLVGLLARKSSWLASHCQDLPFHPVGFRNEVDMLSVYNIYRTIKSSECNVIHCIGHRDLVATALARQLPGCPRTVLLKGEHSFPDANLSPLFRWSYTQCDAIVCVSEALRKAVTEAVAPKDTVTTAVIHNGSEHPAPLRPAESLEDRPLKIGVLSPLRPGKGHSDFLIAASHLSGKAPAEIEFSIAGEGELRADLESQASTLGLKVNFLGHVENPSEYLNGLDLSVVPSHQETFSLVASETMACGRALICTDCEGIVEICRDYPAVIYPVGNIEKLSQALQQFCQNPQTLLDASFALAPQARERFSSSKMADAYVSLYYRSLEISQPSHG